MHGMIWSLGGTIHAYISGNFLTNMISFVIKSQINNKFIFKNTQCFKTQKKWLKATTAVLKKLVISFKLFFR